jgi:hypothetical protein
VVSFVSQVVAVLSVEVVNQAQLGPYFGKHDTHVVRLRQRNEIENSVWRRVQSACILARVWVGVKPSWKLESPDERELSGGKLGREDAAD